MITHSDEFIWGSIIFFIGVITYLLPVLSGRFREGVRAADEDLAKERWPVAASEAFRFAGIGMLVVGGVLVAGGIVAYGQF